MTTPMQASRKIMLFKLCREALVKVPYRDGVWNSIGVGHNGPDVDDGDKLDTDKALDLLVEDVRKRDVDLNRFLKGLPVKQHEYDALLDLYYQGGSDGLLGGTVRGKPSPGVLHFLRKGDLKGAHEEYLKWDENAKHEPNFGLYQRRVRGGNILLNGDYGDLTQYPVYDSHPKPGGKGRKADYFEKITDDTLKGIP